MAWALKGTWYESCSCELFCPCNLGPAKPTQEWCSGLIAYAVESGESNGVDLGATRFVLHESSSPKRGELEAIVQGKRGGVWEGVAGMIRESLPSNTTQVQVTGGESPRVSVGGVADITMERVRTEDGKPTVVTNAPLFPGFAIDRLEMTRASGRVCDPDLRQWETLGNGGAVPFDWSF